MAQPAPSSEEFIVFGAPDIRQEEIDEMVATLKSGWLGTGPKVHRFEEDVKAYKGSPHAAAVNSCTAALHLSMVAADLRPGDEVITTALTFCATVNAIIHAGALPVLADVDPVTMNIDVSDVERKITPRTRAVLPVHFAGRPCDMDRLTALAQKHGLLVIEDCAHAMETEWKGKKAGTFGDFGALSFYVTKNVITGEGGMVLCRDQKYIDRVKILALHGMSKDAWARFSDAGYKHYYVTEAGFKYNLTDMHASLGIHQLKRVEENWLTRRKQWGLYDEAFAGLPIGLPAPIGPGERHAYHLYTILVDEPKAGIARDRFLEEMTKRKIGTGVHYLAIPEHPYYQKRFGWKPEDFPHATAIGRGTVSLPLGPGLRAPQQQRVIDAVVSILKK